MWWIFICFVRGREVSLYSEHASTPTPTPIPVKTMLGGRKHSFIPPTLSPLRPWPPVSIVPRSIVQCDICVPDSGMTGCGTPNRDETEPVYARRCRERKPSARLALAGKLLPNRVQGAWGKCNGKGDFHPKLQRLRHLQWLGHYFGRSLDRNNQDRVNKNKH